MKKKVLSSLLLLSMAIFLTACSCKDTSPDISSEEIISEDDSDISDDELSQSEWMEKYGNDLMEDGYEKVDSVNIDSGDTKLEYVSHEVYTLENGEDVVLVNFRFSNISAGSTNLDSQYNFSAFQDGIEIAVYSSLYDEVAGDANRRKEILDGASIDVSIAIAPDNWSSEIKLRIDDNMAYDSVDTPHLFQQQTLSLQ